jgi:predicted nuclease of predicted toxin-antitoxin system
VIKIAVDENFDHHILRALVRRVPQLDFRTIQGQAMTGFEDPEVLAWAAAEDRVLLTHDVRTVTRFAYERVARGDAMPGVIEIPSVATVSEALEDLVLVVTCSTADDCRDQVIYLPWQKTE